MSNTKMKLLKQIGTLALCLCMIVSCLPVSAFAETEEGLCEHHHEHTAECGYVAAVEGQPCTHVHTDGCYSIAQCAHEHNESCGYSEGTPASDCTHECGEECAEGCIHEHDDACGYAEATEATPCSHICSIEGGCYALTCSHAVEDQHDDACGYVAAVEGSPCKYECNEDHGEEETSAPAYTAEEVKAMIDALPSVSELESMDSDELNSVYEQAQEAYDAFETLTDEEQIELADELVKLRDVLDFLTTPVNPLASQETAGFTITGNDTVYYWYSGNGESYWRAYYSINTISNINVSLDGTALTISWNGKYNISNMASSSAGFDSEVRTWTYTIEDFSCGSDVNITLSDYVDTTGLRRTNWTITRSAGHNYTNGICDACGDYQQAEKNGENYYEISNLGQLCWFAQKVNAQEITSHSAILTADITIDNSVVWVPISLADHSGSTFDGNNHTITFANTRDGSTFGLFANYNYSTIKNLYLAGSITCNQSGDTSALVNRAYSTTIQNVISTCTVNNSGTGLTGGLTGYFGGGSATIKNCAVYADVTGGGYAGGLIGSIWNGNQTIQNVSNCAYMGSVTGGNKAGALVGYNGNNSGKKSPFTDVYYCEKNGLGYLGATYGGTITATRVESVTADQFKSGEVAYKLNNGITDGTQAWYQTCQSDNYPKFSGNTVYMGYICGSGSSNPVYQNTADNLKDKAQPEHSWKDGVCTNCGATQAAVWDEIEQVYKISNLVQLQWFADKVNGGEISINGKLMANIDASSLTSLAIGVNGKAYSGTFDGNGYTLTIGLNSTAEYAAPFRYVNGATIKNLTVKGFITTNQKFAASIVGLSDGKTTIENCISTVEITSTKSGDGTHGGLVGVVNSGTMTINNCGFVGQINGSGTDSCGGLVGWSNGTANISNSFVAATFTVGNNNGNTFSRGNNITVTNCYYLNALGTVPSGATQKSADKFASGEVAYLLNGSKDNGVWKQTLKTDATPNFSGGAVYKTAPCVDYSNNGSVKEHDYEYGVCKNCNDIQLVAATWSESKQAYEIYSAAQLAWFSKLVNGTLEGVDQNQSANAILMADIDMSAVADYVPIGGTTGLYYSTEGDDKGYQGIFDGNGHVIKNLSVKGSDANELTYGVFGTLSGTVKHLGVENFTFTLGSQDCRAGGIAGQVLSGGLIEDCYVANSTITATGKVAGGIAGCNYAGTIKNCFTYKVTVTATRTGGIVGDNCGDNNSDRKGTIINCYTDASNIENSARAGIVTNSTASVSANDFASGLIGFQLDDERNLWRQTIGSSNYPTFSGNIIKVDGYNITGTVVSAKITWTAMEFTYSGSAGTWNPDTHSYSGSTGAWSPVDGGGKITVENTGADELRVKFEFVNSIDGITGNFDVPTSAVASGSSIESKLNITGSPNRTGFNNLKIGSINVTLSKNITSTTWNVGDKVTWYGDDGNAYSCYVVSKSDDKYVLMTDKPFKNGDRGSLNNILSAVNATGGRVPNWDDASEKDFVSTRACQYCNSSWHCALLFTMNGDYKTARFSEWSVSSNILGFTSNTYYFVWLAFDVPIC